MKVILLGATGFIGNHTLRELLKRGYEVRVLVRKSSDRELLRNIDVKIFEGDFKYKQPLIKSMEGCDALIHCAGYYPRYSIRKREELSQAMKEIANVLEASVFAGVKKLVYVSSIGTIWKDENGIGREDIPFDYKKVKGLYHRIKYLMEEKVKVYSKIRIEPVIVNPTFCVGEYERKPIQYCLIPRVIKGMPFYLDGKMNAVDVKDVARGIILALEKGRTSERYILGGENLTIKEFLGKIAKLGGVRAPFIKIPYSIALPFGYISEYFSYRSKKKPLIPLTGIHMAKFSFFVSIEKAKKELGYSPFPIDDAIERAIYWFKKIGYI